MSARTFPGIGLVGGRSNSESGWATEMNNNLLNTSVLVNLKIISRIAAVPGTATQGDLYILTSSPNLNAIAAYDNGAWVYITPQIGFRCWDNNTGKFIYFNGTTWVDEFTLPSSTAAGLVLLSKVDISNNTQIDFTTGFDQGYDNFLLRAHFNSSSTGTFIPFLRLRDSGSWLTGANYGQMMFGGRLESSTVTNVNTKGSGASSFQLGYEFNNTYDDWAHVEASIVSTPGRKALIHARRATVDAGGYRAENLTVSGATSVNITALSGIRLFCTTSSYLEGSAYLYAYRKNV